MDNTNTWGQGLPSSSVNSHSLVPSITPVILSSLLDPVTLAEPNQRWRVQQTEHDERPAFCFVILSSRKRPIFLHLCTTCSELICNISTILSSLLTTTACPRSSDPFYIVSYYINWVTTSQTYCSIYYHFLMFECFPIYIDCMGGGQENKPR